MLDDDNDINISDVSKYFLMISIQSLSLQRINIVAVQKRRIENFFETQCWIFFQIVQQIQAVWTWQPWRKPTRKEILPY